MCKNKMKKGVLCSALCFCMGMAGVMFYCVAGETVVAVASEMPETEVAAIAAEETVTGEAEAGSVGMAEGEGAAGSVSETAQTKEPAFDAKEKFVIFVCCLFSVSLCLVLALFGNPNDRLKDKYKRARKQQMLLEKRQKEKEAREAKRAAAEAKYAEELAQYEADMKAYEEEKAAKKAEKEAKKK